MAISKIQKRILSDLLKYKFIAQSIIDQGEVFYILPDKTKMFLKGNISFNQLKDAEMVTFIKEIGDYKYYKLSDTGLLQIMITNNRNSLRSVNKII